MNVVELPMTVVLGSTNLTVGQFLTLSVGDVITLDSLTSSPVKVMVGDEPYLLGRPGTIGKNRGVQILDIIDKDVENYE